MRIQAGPCRIACLEGRVWVTASGQSADALLTAGQDVVYTGNRLVVVQALDEATVRVQPRLASRTSRPALAPQPAQ